MFFSRYDTLFISEESAIYIYQNTREANSQEISVAKDGLNLPETENEKKRRLIVGIRIIAGMTERCARTIVANSLADIKNMVDNACVFFPNSCVVFFRAKLNWISHTYIFVYYIFYYKQKYKLRANVRVEEKSITKSVAESVDGLCKNYLRHI